MAPKPFPFPLGVGVDVCQVNRIAAVICHEHTRNHWARKIFTRLEWPALCRRMQRAEKAIGEPGDQKLHNENQAIGESYGNAIWMLPRLSGYSSTFEDENLYRSAIADERSTLGVLARHLAGRWAAKEAVIKAHRHRQLYMQDISIVTPSLSPCSSFSTDTSGAQKVIALIDPPGDDIKINERVATLRGLRGFGVHNRGLHKGALKIKPELLKEVQDLEDREPQIGLYYHRRSRFKESDRQVAEINISHDGGYAVAMCMAFDPRGSAVRKKTVVDQGKGPPLHEPQWGDEGWLDLADTGFEGGSSGLDVDPALDIPLGNLLDKPDATDPDVVRKGIEKTFKD